MQISVRSYLTAGIAVVGAGVIAITPVAPPMPAVTVASPEVQLSAVVNPITPWFNQFNTASDNATTLADTFFNAPAPLLQQFIVNQSNYLGQLLNNPADIENVVEQLGTNLQKVFQTATFLGLDFTDEANILTLAQSNDNLHSLLVAFLPFVLPATIDEQTKAIIIQVVQVLASPASGVLIGLAGPVISPVVALLNGVQALTGAEDFDTALQALADLPANVVGSIFNGATLNLDAVLPLIAGSMPEGVAVTSLSLAFGGLLSTGGTYMGVGTDPNDPQPGIGGSILNSLGISVDLGGFALPIVGQPIGPLGALTNLSQMLANAIGWDGTGNPLTHLTFPTLNPTPTADPLARSAGPEALPKASATNVTLRTDDGTDTALGAAAAEGTEAEPVGTAESDSETAPDTQKVAVKKAGERAAASLKSAGDDVEKAVKKAGDDVEKTVKKAGDDVGKAVNKVRAGIKKALGGKAKKKEAASANAAGE